MANLDRINYLNIGLMLASFAAAFALPFETFLLSYAILGPLHYLTQLSWLHDRKYFLSARRLAIPIVVLTLFSVLCVGLHESISVKDLHYFNADAICVGFGVALIMVVAPSNLWRIGCSAALVLAVGFIHQLNSVLREPFEDRLETLKITSFLPYTGYDLLFVVFLTTLVHVFVFTGAFVLLGALKSKSRSGYLSLVVFIACAFLCFSSVTPQVDSSTTPAVDPTVHSGYSYALSTYSRDAYALVASSMNYFAGMLFWPGVMPDFKDVFTTELGVQIARFIAFAYTYHYLNWFSKTSVIKWHEVSRGRLVVVGLVWVVSIALYYVDYDLGLRWLFLLSMLHVFLEFPLNWRSFHGIGSELWSRFRPEA